MHKSARLRGTPREAPPAQTNSEEQILNAGSNTAMQARLPDIFTTPPSVKTEIEQYEESSWLIQYSENSMVIHFFWGIFSCILMWNAHLECSLVAKKKKCAHFFIRTGQLAKAAKIAFLMYY
jgi:hypothetical protein